MAIDINGLNSNATNANRSGAGKAVVAPKTAPAPDAAAPAKGGADTVQISAQAQSLNRISGQIGKEAFHSLSSSPLFSRHANCF